MSTMCQTVKCVLGNTKPKRQPTKNNACKRWIFTLHKFDKKDIDNILTICAKLTSSFFFGEEKGKGGETPHLQGFIILTKKKRLSFMKKMFGNRFHFEIMKGTKDDNIRYCSKEGNLIRTNMKLGKKKNDDIKIIHDDQLYKWQVSLINDIKKENENCRTINWIWSTKGKTGKSQFCKYLIVKHNALCVGGRSTDMKHGICNWIEKNKKAPNIIIVDLSRAKGNKISYSGIEDIKNGFFFSSKYESQMVVFNSPHILIFANEPPLIEMMSEDKWNIINIDETDEVKECLLCSVDERGKCDEHYLVKDFLRVEFD